MFSNLKSDAHCDYLKHGEEHRTHVDGHFYQNPSRFPCVLHDRKGCLFITKERYNELVAFKEFQESHGGAISKLNIRKGISKVLGYKVCSFKETCPKYNARKSNGEIKASTSTRKRAFNEDPIAKTIAQFSSLPPEYQAKFLAELRAKCNNNGEI